MAFSDFDDTKATKKSTNHPLLWCNRFSSLTKLFRLIEFCVATAVFSWIFNRLPFAVTISGHFFRQIAAVIATPLFVFLLCNAIIITLIVKSERFSGEIPAADNAEAQFYEELLENHKYSSSKQFSPEDCSAPPPNATAGEIEFQDKEMISDGCNAEATEMCFVSDSDSDSDSDAPRVYRRWKSENLERREKEIGSPITKLRRSETEKFIYTVKQKSEIDGGGGLCHGDEMSDEEFRRAVDDFIAKHLRFRRQESQVNFHY